MIFWFESLRALKNENGKWKQVNEKGKYNMNTILASSNRILSAQLSFARICLLSLCWFRSNIVRFSLFPRILRSLALLGRWRSKLRFIYFGWWRVAWSADSFKRRFTRFISVVPCRITIFTSIIIWRRRGVQTVKICSQQPQAWVARIAVLCHLNGFKNRC